MESKHAMETLKAKASVAAEIAAEEAKLGTVVSERNTAEKEGEKLLVKVRISHRCPSHDMRYFPGDVRRATTMLINFRCSRTVRSNSDWFLGDRG